MHILLIEPSRLLAEQYCRFFESRGHSIAWREDAQGGVIAADEQKPDVVIVELLLAGHSGVEFLYEFRSYADWLEVPALLLSNVRREAAKIASETLSRLGVSTYLYKPETSLRKLELSVNKAVAESRV